MVHGVQVGYRPSVRARWIGLASVGVALFGAASWVRGRAEPPAARPNVLLIVWDTVRADRLGLYGHDRPTTPHLEAMARDSVVFERALSPGIWTLPSHASLFTGLAPESTGADERWLWLDAHHTTLAEHFGAHGYDTFAFAANALLSQETNLVQGFRVVLNTWKGKVRPLARQATIDKLIPGDRSNELAPGWRPPDHGATNAEWDRAVFKEAGPLIAEGLLRWLDQRDSDAPWLAYLNLMEAHTPRVPSLDARRKVMDEDAIARSLALDQSHIRLHFYNFGKQAYSDSDLEVIRGVYDAALVELDQVTGELVAALDRRGILEDTIVVITSDHGENLGDHHLFNHRFALWNSLAHVPLVVRWPRALAPARVERPVSTRDIFPTLARWAGIPTGSSRDLLAAVDVPVTHLAMPLEREIRTVQNVHPDVVVAPWLRQGHAVHGAQFKLLRWSTGARELYDVLADPGESTDVSAERTAEVHALDATLDAYVMALPRYDPERRTERDAPRNVRASQADLRNQLEALGYIQDDPDDPANDAP